MFDRTSRIALIVAVVVLIGSGLGFRVAVGMLNIYLQKQPVSLRDSLTNIPRTLGPWQAQGKDTVLDQATIEELGTDKYLDRVYVLRDGGQMYGFAVHVAYYTGFIDAVPHVPDRCFVAGGWNIVDGAARNETLPIDTSAWTLDGEHLDRYEQPYRLHTFSNWVTGEPITVRMPALEGSFELRTSQMQHNKRSSERLFAGYCFIANGCFTPSPDGVRAFAFDQRDQYSYYCKLQFVATVTPGMTREKFLELSASLMGHLLPEVMRCLPDWVEVNESSAPASAMNL